MGGRNSRPRRPPRLRGRGPFRPPLGPINIPRILLEEVIRAIVEDIIHKIDQRRNPQFLTLSETSNCCAVLPAGQVAMMSLKSSQNDEATMSTEEMVLKLLNEIPPEYVDQLQNPEELVKRLNIDVPPECMPEVAAALKKYYQQRHPG